MKIRCPKCEQVVPASQVNVSADLALCPECNEGFKVSEAVDADQLDPGVLENPPGGAWFRKEMDQVVVGASTRSPAAFFLVPFMCVWSGGSLGGIYGSQIASGEFNLALSLFGIPFVIGSIIFWTLALMAVCGKSEVTIRDSGSTVFVGVGSLGWTRRFEWSTIETVREAPHNMQNPGGGQGAILLEGRERIRFGTGLNEKRRCFVLNALKYLRAASRRPVDGIGRGETE